MTEKKPAPARLVLRCVQCTHTPLESVNGVYRCRICSRTYPVHAHKSIPVFISERSPLKVVEILASKVEPHEVDMHIARGHWKTGKLAELLDSVKGKTLLSYGGGDGGDRWWLESKGFQVTSFDVYPGDFTDYICDGHELPFADGSFDIVTSTAVFEHLYNPFQAAKEISRVLKDGGVLIGSSAFLEPFHANSYFHMSHLGLREIFQRAGFKVVELYPGWSSLEAVNANFWIWNKVKFIRRMSARLNRIKFAWGRKLWQWGYAAKGRPLPERVQLGFSGSLIFKAVK